MDIKIALVTFNRPRHTSKVLQGLRREGVTDFIIYIDKVEKVEDMNKQEELFSIIDGIDWADVEVVPRSENLGLAKSIESAVFDTLENHDAIILLEDDCVPKPGFINYMSNSLTYLEKERSVRSVCGYSYPGINRDLLIDDIYFIERFCPWGWGTWSNRWKDYRDNLEEILMRIRENGKCLERIGKDIVEYCESEEILKHRSEIWSLNWILAHVLTGTLAAYPKNSLIDNIGFDGTGVHSKITDAFTHSIEESAERITPRTFEGMSITVDELIQQEVVQYLEKYSKMTMVLNGE